MTAPSYVPIDPADRPRDYTSRWRRPEPWMPDRPGETVGKPHPRGGLYGNQGPDIGYAYKLIVLAADRIIVQSGEEREDIEKGCVGVAMRRGSLIGRAPVMEDLDIAFTIWGFCDEQPDPTLLERRREMFEGAGGHHGYDIIKAIVAAVPDSTLAKSLDEVKDAHRANWSSLLELP